MEVKQIFGVFILTMMLAGTAAAQTPTPTALVVDYDQTLVPSGMQPGDVKPLYIVIANTGGLPARDVHATLPTYGGGIYAEGPSSESVSSAGDWFLGTINPDGTARLVTSLRVADDARIGTQYLTLYLTYDESRYDADGRLRTEEKTSKWIIPVDVAAGSLLELGGYQVSVDELKAGDNIQLSLTLKNTGEADALDVTSYLGMPKDGSPVNTGINLELASAFTVLGTVDKKVGDIPSDSTGVVGMVIHIDEDVESKAYTLPVTAEYEDGSGTEHTDVFYVGVYVTGERKLTITNFESDPGEIHSDEEDVEFTGNIENQGTEQVKNVKVTFEPQFPLKNARSYVQAKEVGALKGASSVDFTFYADVEDNVDPQQANVNFILDYEIGGQGFHDEIAYTIDILEHPHFVVQSQAPPTQPTSKSVAKVTVDNIGSKCDGVTVIVLEKRGQPFEFEDKSAYIGDLDKGDRGVASIAYTVEEKASPQPHIVPIEIRCTKNDDVLVFDKAMKLEVAQQVGGGLSAVTGLAGLALIAFIVYTAYKAGHRRACNTKGAKK
jgi:hypothetical protein